MDPLERPSDYVILLPQMSKAGLTLSDATIIRKKLDSLITSNQAGCTMLSNAGADLKNDKELRAIIRAQAIFESFISGGLVPINGQKRVVAIEGGSQEPFVDCHFDKYCRANSTVLIKAMAWTHLKGYLGIEDRTVFQLYADIVMWSCENDESPLVMREHMRRVKDVYNRTG